MHALILGILFLGCLILGVMGWHHIWTEFSKSRPYLVTLAVIASLFAITLGTGLLLADEHILAVIGDPAIKNTMYKIYKEFEFNNIYDVIADNDRNGEIIVWIIRIAFFIIAPILICMTYAAGEFDFVSVLLLIFTVLFMLFDAVCVVWIIGSIPMMLAYIGVWAYEDIGTALIVFSVLTVCGIFIGIGIHAKAEEREEYRKRERERLNCY